MTTSDSAVLRTPVQGRGDTTEAQGVLVDYFRCPAQFAAFDTEGDLSSEEGYFSFGEAVGYGRHAVGTPSASLGGRLNVATRPVTSAGRPCLPFDLSEVITNLRQEQYVQSAGSAMDRLTSAPAIQGLYYFLRPLLPVSVRRHLQKIRLSGWERIAFPRWPVDFSVELLMEQAIALILKHSSIREIPFIWFWPSGAPSCVVMTHDVEGPVGRDFCSQLMDLDESFGIKSAFQIVPEVRGSTSGALVDELRARGFEVNLHDLNHDGYLFHNKPQFLERAAQINRYTRELGCRGFRAGAMYREQHWFEVFEFSYDMSVPNAAHLEPQRGGCCTVMPYFVGKILELPLTTTQDYSLFHILGDYSIELWKRQIDLIRAKHGLITFITHPDYLVEPRARAVYHELLAHLRGLHEHGDVWAALPGDVDTWWRDRREMTLVPSGRSWRIDGPGSDRARVAYATLDGDRVAYGFESIS